MNFVVRLLLVQTVLNALESNYFLIIFQMNTEIDAEQYSSLLAADV